MLDYQITKFFRTRLGELPTDVGELPTDVGELPADVGELPDPECGNRVAYIFNHLQLSIF